jgi:hypothetical protein
MVLTEKSGNKISVFPDNMTRILLDLNLYLKVPSSRDIL